jgi:Flp pilus assembly protein TadG
MPSSIGSERRRHARRGQATVEFALVIPVVMIMVLGLVVVAVAVRNELAVELAAREAARAAAVSADPSAASEAAARAVDLPLEIATTSDGATVTVTVTHVDPVDVAIIGDLIGPITHTASVTMALEPP